MVVFLFDFGILHLLLTLKLFLFIPKTYQKKFRRSKSKFETFKDKKLSPWTFKFFNLTF